MRPIMLKFSEDNLIRCILPVTLCALLSTCSILTPKIHPGEVIFQDDFSLEDSGWDRYSDSLYTADYHDGAYVIKVDGTNMTAWGRPGIELEDVLIRVEGFQQAGPLDNVYGVICRYEDPENFYFFLVSGDGYAGIGRYLEGEIEPLNHETLLPSDAIASAEDVNLIQAACIRNELTLWVNGEVIAQALAPDPTIGDVGLIVGTYDEGGVEIRFDNFSTLMP
jgi:hypothetical protein